jgi:hypothetical protein
MTNSVDTTYFSWRVEQGEKETLVIPVLDEDNEAFPIPGWVVDAQIKTRAGGDILYTWPAEYAQVTDGDTSVTLTIPGPVSEAWTFRTGWYRVVVTDPGSDLDNPTSERILQGPFVVDAG